MARLDLTKTAGNKSGSITALTFRGSHCAIWGVPDPSAGEGHFPIVRIVISGRLSAEEHVVFVSLRRVFLVEVEAAAEKAVRCQWMPFPRTGNW